MFLHRIVVYFLEDIDKRVLTIKHALDDYVDCAEKMITMKNFYHKS